MTWANGLTTDGNPEVSVSENPWDVVKFAGQSSYGVAKVTSRAPANLDKQKQSGAKGSRMVDKGDDPIEFDIEITLQPAEYDLFALKILPLLRSKSSNHGRSPLTFYHPLGELWGVDKILVGDIDIPQPKPGGTLVVSIKAFQWIKKAPKVKVKETVADIAEEIFGNTYAVIETPSATTAYQQSEGVFRQGTTEIIN